MAKIYLPSSVDRTGVDVTYHKKGNALIIGGWCYGQFDIKSTQMPLAEFFKQLGITRRDCERAFAQQPASDGQEGK